MAMAKPSLKATRGILHGEWMGAFPSGYVPVPVFEQVLRTIDVPYPAVQKTVESLKKPGDIVKVDDLLNWTFVPTGCIVDAEGRSRTKQDRYGSYDWLRKANDEDDREERRQVSAFTQRAVDCRGYTVGSERTVCLNHVEEMLAKTCLVSPTCSGAKWPTEMSANGALPLPTWTRHTRLSMEKRVVLEVARDMTQAGLRVVAVNAASAYHAGGGFTSGGRHALEEALCEQSSIYDSLVRAGDLAEAAGVKAPSWVQPPKRRDGGEWGSHIPDDGVILSPFVEIFRGGTFAGYPFEDTAVALEAIVSVAMPNRNTRMSDSPVDAHPDPAQYEEQVKRKWRSVLTAAAFFTEANCVVLPDAGCGVFYNPPDKLGAALGCVLREEFKGRFDQVVVAFPGGKNGQAFFEAAEAAYEGRFSNEPANNAQAFGAVWEFSVRNGFEAFTSDCQPLVEELHVAFKKGGPDEGRVPCKYGTIIVNFTKMTQHMEGSSRCRDIRRRETS